MPRGPTGTYTLPELPFVAGTPALAAEVNSNFSDVGAGLSASLDRYGNGGMLAPVRGVDGTLAAPAYSFTAEIGSGWMRAAAGDLRLSVLGSQRLKATALGIDVTGALSATERLSAEGADFAQDANAESFASTAGIAAGTTLSSGALATLHSLQVTNGATVGTTLGVTGVATFTAQASFTAGADMTGDKIVNLGTPTAGTDATTKTYVDNADTSLQNQITGEVARGHGVATFAASDANLPLSATRFLPPGWAAALTTDVAFWIAPAAGTIRTLRVWANTAAGGPSTVFTVMVNGVASAVTCTLASAANSASDVVNTAAVAAGDRVSLRAAVGAGASGPGLVSASVKFVAS